MSKVLEQVEAIVAPITDELQLELVDIVFEKEYQIGFYEFLLTKMVA